MQGLIGKKIGMSRIFGEDGSQIPVTVIECGPCVVLQKKTRQTDGYNAVVLGYQDQKESRLSKALSGRYKKVGATPKRIVREFRVDEDVECKAGSSADISIFDGAGFVDVMGITKGRGFQGVVKRYRMAGGPHGHGGHSKRRPGSIGCCEIPARVYKGRKMPGHMGNIRVTQQNLEVAGVIAEEHILLVKGAVPGPAGGILQIWKSVKKGGKKK